MYYTYCVKSKTLKMFDSLIAYIENKYHKIDMENKSNKIKRQ